MNSYKIVQIPEFRRKLAGLGPKGPIHEVLEIALSALGTDPYSFRPVEIVDETGKVSTIRSVRTQIYLGEAGTTPPLVIFFEILENSKQVNLLDIAQRTGFGLGYANF